MRIKRKHGRRKHKWTLITVLIIGVIVIFSAALYQGRYQGQPSEPEQKEAKEYFEIINATVDWGEFRENGSVLMIYQMSFSLKAVGGNATWVTVNHKGYYMAAPVDLGNMTKGEVKYVPLKLTSLGYVVKLTDKGFPITIPVFCEEAEGDITIYL